MILRKPYAFLIKHFRFMHVVLSICIFYLIYRTSLMINYINEYIENTISVVGNEIIGTLFDWGVIFLPILILVFAGILLFVMTLKDKPRLFYILMIIVHIAIGAVYLYAYSTFEQMEKTIIDMRTVKMLRDLLLYVIMAQSIFSVFAVVRGVGFDIKKFNFNTDLQDLEISLEDNEEFEVALNFDLNDKKRSGRKILRYTKYWIKEHKLIVNSALTIISVAVIFLLGVRYFKEGKTYAQNKNFAVGTFQYEIKKSYVLNTDLNGRKITSDDYFLVVVDLAITNNAKVPAELILGAIELDIAGDKYYHTSKYEYQLTDLGIVYKNEKIDTKIPSQYLLVFEVPKTAAATKMKIGFRDSRREETIYARLSPTEFKDKKVVHQYDLGETIDFSDSTLRETTLTIDSYEIRNKFTLHYNYCSPKKQECLLSVEYLTPDIFSSNYNKSLLKIKGNFKFDETIISDNIKDIYGLFKSFMTIEYVIDGETRYQKVYLGHVTSKRVRQENTYYIEVFQEIKIADEITLIFNVRDQEYKYHLK